MSAMDRFGRLQNDPINQRVARLESSSAVATSEAIPSGSTDRITTRREAAHFLRQVTLSPTPEEINEAVALGSRRAYLAKYIYMPESQRAFPAWDDSTSPPTPLGGYFWRVFQRLTVPRALTTTTPYGYPGQRFTLAMMLTAFLGNASARANDIVAADDESVRLKATWALSKFIVTSVPGGAYDSPDKNSAIMAWYSILHRYAFRNYADLLEEVTYSFPMSLMLTYYGNKREVGGVRPDENYAREIMQLFTIGLYEMNLDGSYKLDAAGARIPTYSQADITEMSKVFTGLTRWSLQDSWYSDPSKEGDFVTGSQALTAYAFHYYDDLGTTPISGSTYQAPKAGVPPRLRHFLPFYETGAKSALGGRVNIPAGTEARQNIRMAIEALVGHPSCAPFVARNLIKQTVTSNPSPAYIARVASAFEDNGRGARGDLSAVWMAIWTDPEASHTIHSSDRHGRARDGFEVYAALVRGMHRESTITAGPLGYGTSVYFDEVLLADGAPLRGVVMDDFRQNDMGVWPIMAPSIFGHYSPDYSRAPADAWGVVVPEMESKPDSTLMRQYVNMFGTLIHSREPRDAETQNTPRCLDYSVIFGANYTLAGAPGVSGIVETCNELFCGGTLSKAKIDAIITATQGIGVSTDTGRQDRVTVILELVSKTTEFMVM